MNEFKYHGTQIPFSFTDKIPYKQTLQFTNIFLIKWYK